MSSTREHGSFGETAGTERQDMRVIFEITLVKSGRFSEEEASKIADVIFEGKDFSLVDPLLMHKYNRFILWLARQGGES